MEPIIDMETYQQYMKTKKKLKAPSYDSRQYGLLPGLLGCTCGYKWQLTGATRQYSNTQGKIQNRQTIQGTYRCPNRYEERISNDCPRRIQRLEADSFVWEQVTSAINRPEILITQARLIAQGMQESGTTVNYEKEQIEKELEQITYQRQWIITQTRKGGLTEEDMERELENFSLQEIKLKQSLKDVLSTSNTPVSQNWEVEFQEKLEDLQQGIQALQGEQKNRAEWLAAFEVKRLLLQSIRHLFMKTSSPLYIGVNAVFSTPNTGGEQTR